MSHLPAPEVSQLAQLPVQAGGGGRWGELGGMGLRGGEGSVVKGVKGVWRHRTSSRGIAVGTVTGTD